MRFIQKMKMKPTNDYSNITTKELADRADGLSLKADVIRQNILKQCDELERIFRELVSLKEELQSRVKE